jgi:hypothetical protein
MLIDYHKRCKHCGAILQSGACQITSCREKHLVEITARRADLARATVDAEQQQSGEEEVSP